jgi:CSLREA domain-containing protein/uncharacterized repeat protein (TIGR01451 family)
VRVVTTVVSAAALGVLVASALAGALAPAESSTGFVVRAGTELELDGHPWHLYGASTYGTSNPGAGHSISAEISLAQSADLNTLRIVDMFDSSGVDSAAPYDDSAWVRVDSLLAEMREAGLHAVLDLSAFRNHLQSRELYLKGNAAIAAGYATPAACAGLAGDERSRCVGTFWCIENESSCSTPYGADNEAAWQSFLQFVATRVNTVTGVEYRSDPTIAIVSFAGEPNPPNSGEPLKPTTQELTDFYSRVFDEWKAYDPNHLVTTGGLLHIDWEELYGGSSGIDHEAIFSLPNQDVLSIHDYFGRFPATAANDTKTEIIAAAAEDADKPWIIEEFGFLQKPFDPASSMTYTEADRGEWFRNVFQISRAPPVGVPAAGVAFWNLGPEVREDSHDVNPDTPATWAAVLQFAPSSTTGGVTERVDLEADGDEPSSGWSPGSTAPSVSDNGRWVALTTTKALDPADPSDGTNRVYVKDMETGAVVRVTASIPASDGATFGGVISASGRFVAFWTQTGRVVVHDRDSDVDGTFDEPGNVADEPATVNSSGIEQSCGYVGANPFLTLSSNGRFVLFDCGDSALVAGDTNGGADVHLRDRQAETIEIVSLSLHDELVPGGGASVYGGATISDDGRYVAFLSESADIDPVGDPDRRGDVYIRDRASGTTQLVSLSSSGEKQNDYAFQTPVISRDGTMVIFASYGSNLVADDENETQDVFLRDLGEGTTERVSIADDDGEAAGFSGGGFSNYGPNLAGSLSADGRYVVFVSYAANLAAGDTNGTQDVYLRDRQDATTERISVPSAGDQFQADADKAVVTPDGRYVVFEVGQQDVYRRDRLGAAVPQGEPTFTVNTTDDIDDGACTTTHCSLREAISRANSLGSHDTIRFDIEEPLIGGVHTIRPSSPLPQFGNPNGGGADSIDGTSEPDFASCGDGPVVEIDGSNAGAGADGIRYATPGTFKGLIVNSFDGAGLLLVAGTERQRIECNYIGTDATGTAARPNTVGLLAEEGGDIGGPSPEQRNVISGNGIGIQVEGGATVVGNYIGTDATGTAALGNGDGILVDGGRFARVGGADADEGNVISGNRVGIRIEASESFVVGNFIGTDAAGSGSIGNELYGVEITGAGSPDGNAVLGNVIAFSGRDGVAVEGGPLHEISENRIHSNGELGIDLGADGVTANDPGDGDDGANHLQNFPVLTRATSRPGQTEVAGSLATLDGTYRVELFSSPECDPSGHGEGRAFLGFEDVVVAGGFASFTAALPVETAVGEAITATATPTVTDPGSTSEFSACIETSPPVPPQRADLEVSLVARPVTGIVGDEFTFEPTVTNRGPNPATGVSLSIVLPAGVSLLAAPGCTGSTTLTCALSDLAVDARATVSIRVRPTVGGVLQTQGATASSTDDPAPSNNTARLFTVVSAPSPLWAWGNNCHGVVGDGSLPTRPSHEAVPGLSGVAELVGSYRDGVFARTTDGHVQAWGTSIPGDGTSFAKRVAPVNVAGLMDVVDLASSGGHRLAATAAGAVYAWGDNTNGRLGRPSPPMLLTAALVPGLPAIAKVAAGGDFSLALDRAGQVWSWGVNDFGQLGVPGGLGAVRTTADVIVIPGSPRIVDVAAGEFGVAFALDDTGRLWSWGNNASGWLADGTTVSRSIPAPVLTAAGVELAGVTAIEAGTSTHFAVAGASGQVFSWGQAPSLGRPSGDYSPFAQPIPGLAGVRSLEAAENHAIAALADGSVRAWGANQFGMLGTGDYVYRDTPTLVPGLAGVMSVGASHAATFVVLTGGTVRSAGYACQGERGDGTETRRPFPQRAANGLADVISLAAGTYHTLAVRLGGTENGTVWGWGTNYRYSLGPTGLNSAPKALPERVNALTEIRRVAAGPETTYALHGNGTLYAWGGGGFGGLGTGSTFDTSDPAAVLGTGPVVDFDAGTNGGIALARSGAVFTWGRNSSGQLGNGTLDVMGDPPDHPVPAQVAGLDGVVDVDAGSEYNLALRADGAIFAWGSNGAGQLGDGTTQTRTTPVRIADLPRIVALAAGGRSLALAEDGTVWAWGGCGLACATPQRVNGLSEIVAIDVSSSGMRYALRRDGVLFSWGPSANGEAGTGSFGSVNEPTAVLGLTGVTAMRGGGMHAIALGDPTLSGTVDQASGAGAATTDGEADGATPRDAIETSVSTFGGAITIREEPAADVLPVGYSVPGGLIVITAPAQSASNPIRITFRLDASQVPNGLTVATIAAFRNGVQVGECPGSAVASPDPCIALRQSLADGDVLLTVLTSQASTWILGWPAPVADAGGPYHTAPGTPVQLDATRSSNAARYEWTPDSTLTGPWTATPTFTSNSSGDFPVTLRVTDTAGQTATASTIVSVRPSAAASVCSGPPPAGAIVRGPGNDTINGTPGNDVIFDSGGSNSIDGKAGNDTICTGSGNDKIDGGSGDDVVVDAGGSNTINGADGNDRITSGAGTDKLDGGAGNDYLEDRGGDNTVNGAAGVDVLLAGSGNDKINAGDGADTVVDAGGTNTVSGAAGADVITTGAGNDTVDGGAGADTINGGGGRNAVDGSEGDDTIITGSGSDTIDGGAGNDFIDAGAGNDTLKGAAGDDTLKAGAGDDTVDGGAGNDVCYRGGGTDAIKNCEVIKP